MVGALDDNGDVGVIDGDDADIDGLRCHVVLGKAGGDVDVVQVLGGKPWLG